MSPSMRELIEQRLSELDAEIPSYWEEQLRKLIRPDTVDVFMQVCHAKPAEKLKHQAQTQSLLYFLTLTSNGSHITQPLGVRAVRQWIDGDWREPWPLPEPLPSEPGRLREALSSPEPLVRASAAAALGQLGEEARSAADDLVACLKDEDARVRLWATWALEGLRPTAPAVADALRAALGPASLVERLWLTWALVRLACDDEQLSEWYWHHEPPPTAALPDGTVESLRPALSHPDLRVRREAADLFSFLGTAAHPAAEELLRLVEDEDFATRYSALLSLANLGPAFPASLPRALALLESDADDSVRAAALEVCARFGLEALPALVRALDDSGLRARAAKAIGDLGPAAAPLALDALITRLDAPPLEVPEALGRLGPSALAATEPLARLVVHERDTQVRCAAGEALRALGADEVAARAAWELASRMRASPPSTSPGIVSRGHFYVLAALGAPAVPAVLALLEDGNPLLTHEALSALERMEVEPRAAEPGLIALVGSPDVEFRYRAAALLERMTPPSDAARAALAALRERERRRK
ncbi:hypothetical protein HPC49_36810 [Pyxidicoccus fallax]|uniref:HEAT repeat domain-containing protein n=1 Tax=Pyxidicoccus fallax TaxID=394095 RepID=A0A848LR33_9BACT|nr:HEAT repeat domain-containing protein [Pyxidicoccus fallax]NMO20368.1 hypothetical protein [Pyxidicoccus fallax]NPC83768.1 hypothetical protein [Pyxidicoccus fallax]